MAQQINLLAIGDKSAGSAAFKHSAHHDHALYTPRHMIKKAFQDKIARVRIGENQYVKVEVWDAAGDTQYHKLLKLPHFQVDICAIFISVIHQRTFENALFKVSQQWYQDIKGIGKNIEIIFVGTDIDEREKLLKQMKAQANDIKQAPLCKAAAQELIQSNLKCRYLECNPKTNEGIRQIYEAAVKIVLQKKVIKMHTVEQEATCDCQLI